MIIELILDALLFGLIIVLFIRLSDVYRYISIDLAMERLEELKREAGKATTREELDHILRETEELSRWLED